MNPTRSLVLFAVVIACTWQGCARAQDLPPSSADARIVGSASFLGAHPDLRYRQSGWKAYEAGNFRKAREQFQRAARYADKPSQGMLGEMIWKGEGGAADRPLAHAWLELAAERGFKVMQAQRDRYWQAMTAAERERSRALLPALRAEYGDAAAQPRLEAVLRRARSQATGSRTGMAGSTTIILPGPGGDLVLDASQFYQEKFWNPREYWAWQSETWRDPPKGQVEVGPLQPGTSP